MNREIKFRVWNKEENKFLSKEKYYLDSDGKLTFITYKWNDTFPNSNCETCLKSINSNIYIIQQFTGLIDKNGKEIYEGDIIKCIDVTSEVIFDTKYSCFSIVGPSSLKSELLGNHIEKVEIIGNVFENSDLLNG